MNRRGRGQWGFRNRGGVVRCNEEGDCGRSSGDVGGQGRGGDTTVWRRSGRCREAFGAWTTPENAGSEGRERDVSSGAKGENRFMEYNIYGDVELTRDQVEAAVAVMVGAVADENAASRTR